MKMESKHRLGLLVAVCVLVGASVAGAAVSQGGGSQLIVAATTPPDTLDPQKSPLNQTWPAWQMSYECLLRVTPDGRILPWLASAYTQNADATVYDFTLRKGVRFHNGRLLTAADVVYTFGRLQREGIPYAKNRFPTLTSVTALSASKVRFTLSSARPDFILNMGDPFTVACAILNRREASANLASKMVGTGPFSMASYSPSRELVMKRFARYWGAKPKFENLKVIYLPDTAAQLVGVSSGRIDLIFPDPSIVKALQGSKQIKLGSVIAATNLRVEMSAATTPFNDPDVRRAVALGIDKRAVVNGAYLGYGSPATYIPRGYRWAPAPSAYENSSRRDLTRAKQLLASAGYPNGFSTNYLYIAGFSPASDRFAQILQSQLSDVGIRLRLDGVDTPTFLARLGRADYGLAFNQYPYFADPSLYVSPRPNRNGPVPGEIQQRVRTMTTARSSADYLQAISALALAEDRLAFPNLAIASPTQFVAYRKNKVRNVKIDYSVSWLFLMDVTVSS